MKKKLLIVLILGVFLLGSVSAATWDNVKSYDRNTKTVTISNSILGIPFLPTGDIATIQLMTPLINYVNDGEEVLVIKYNVTGKEALDELFFGETKTYKKDEFDIGKRNELGKVFIWKYLETYFETVPTYKNGKELIYENGTIYYSKIKNGTELIKKQRWTLFNKRTKIGKDENIILGLFTDIHQGDKIEFVPYFGGKEIDEWATIISTNGAKTIDGGYTVVTFTSNGYFNLTGVSLNNVSILVIAGGGAGGRTVTSNGGGGGGAGGVIYNSSVNLISGNYSIIVGMGVIDASGQDSIFGNDYFKMTAKGGGKGGGSDGGGIGYTGGSSGGDGNAVLTLVASNQGNINGTGYGNIGGSALSCSAGGGGGAGASGGNSTGDGGGCATPPDYSGDGGVGIQNDINGTNIYYAGGGAGGSNYGAGTGGLGGGGDGGVNGTDGTGGGAGGEIGASGITKGGSGIVIIRYLAGAVVVINSPIDNFNTTNPTINFNATVTTPSLNLDNVSIYINDILNETNSSGIEGEYIFTKTFTDQTSTWIIEGCNPVGCANSSSRTFTVDTTPPIVTITSPVGDQGTFTSGINLTLDWSITELNPDSCWYDYNNTNTTVTCNDNTTEFTIDNSTLTSLVFYLNDTFGNQAFNSTTWSYSFIENNVTFNKNVSETSSQFFEMNLSTAVNVLSISAQLNYNGTDYISSASCNGFCTVNNTIDIPLNLGGESEDKDFFWKIDIFNGTDQINVNTSTRSQNVTKIHLEKCGAPYTTQTLNFSVYDEQNLTRLSKFKFDASFDHWLGSGTVKRQNNFTEASILEEPLCITPLNDTAFIDGTIQYDEDGNGTTYTTRNYYFQNDTINNVSQDIFMYLLQSTFSTSFILKVQDDSLLPIPNVLIETKRYYPGTNEFRTVQIAKTDDSGKSIGFFETEIVDYKFLITKDNSNLLETGIQKIVPESTPFTLTFNIVKLLGAPWESYEEIANLISTLTWNETSGIVTYTYIDNSTIFDSARLLVIKESFTNSSADKTICNDQSTLLAGTITCDVGTSNGTYLASSYITRDSVEQLDRQFRFSIQTLSGIVGLLGLFFGWFLILIAAFMFRFNEIAGIWSITATIFLINLTGLISFGGLFVTSIFAIAIIITWVMEK